MRFGRPDMTAQNPTVRAYVLLVITAFCWGCNSVLARVAVGEVSPMLIVSLRWLGVMMLFVFVRQPIYREWEKLKTRLPVLFLMGALGFTLFNALFYLAAHTTTALNIGIIQGIVPVFLLLGARFFYHSPLSLVQGLGVIVTILGVFVIACAGDLQKLVSLSINRGDYFVLVGCLFYSGYALMLRRFSGVSVLSLFAVVVVAAFIASLPLSLAELYLGRLQWPTRKGWIVVILITVLPSFLAQVCFIRGVTELGAGRAGIFVNLVPVFSSILAVSILDEPFGVYHAVALVLVISGIALAESKKYKAVAI